MPSRSITPQPSADLSRAGRIRLHFQHSVKGVDWQKRQAVFEDASGSPRTCAYDLLVASDGRHSKCRRLYQAHDPSFTSFLRPSPKDYAGFSGLTLPGPQRARSPAAQACL